MKITSRIRAASMLGVFLGVCLAALAQDLPVDVKRSLDARYKGRLFYIRDFPQNIFLRYDADGNPLAPVTPGPWTLGLIEVREVDVSPNAVILRGPRVGLQYNKKQKTLTPKRIVDDRIQIHFVRKGLDDVQLLKGKWQEVLIPSNRVIADLVPDPWKRFMRLPVGTDLEKLEPENEPGVFKVKDGIVPPKPLRTPDPEYAPYARQLKISGTSILDLIVDTDGKPKKLQVKVPLGMGLDEQVIKAVEKWQFRPAMKDGVPVPVAITVHVNFRI